MSGERLRSGWRMAGLVSAAVLSAVAAVGWWLFLVRIYAEAPIVAFGEAAPQLQRLSWLLALHFTAAVLLLLAALRLGWLAVQESRRSRRQREAEHLLER